MLTYLIILGPPGAGKGTIAKYITSNSEVVIISTGDLLRSQMRAETELGKEAATYVNAGNLVPDDVILEMVENHITPTIIENGFILDGFPRTRAQADGLDELLDKMEIELDIVPLIEVDREELIRRMLNRRTCSNGSCQAVYSVSYNPPEQEGICDKCGSELISRADQKEEVISNRLDVYEEKTSPLIDYYEKKGLLKRYSHEDSDVIAEMIMTDINLDTQ